MAHTVVIAGVGPGLGESLARRFAAENCHVGLFARSADYLDDLEADLRENGHEAIAVPTDITDPDAVSAGFEAVREAFGPVDTLINHAGGGGWRGIAEGSATEFEAAWRTCALGGFLCSKEALADMYPSNETAADTTETAGTIVFTGATSAVRGRDGAVGFSAAKFAVRGMAESMARELGPQGIHVCHAVIDGGIRPPDRAVEDPEAYLDPDAIADSYWHVTTQDPSAWTLELDLRPHAEEF
jgi:NAD(P)-dependent dehydrogenase (short-subunit alcohol dehydrogenase family)